MLSSKLNENSYISFGYVLANELAIGSIPTYTLTCVKKGKARQYENTNIKIQYLTIDNNLFFGYKTINGVNYATLEKAFLDTLYFHQKGHVFSFNIYSDINISKVNINRINEYLQYYSNPKFVKFVKGYINGKL